MLATRANRTLVLIVLGFVVLPLALLAVFRSAPGLDPLLRSPVFHLAVVSAIAACALQVAVFAAIAASRGRDPRIVLLAVGCLFVGVFMLAHGLTTPGVGAAVSTAGSLYGGPASAGVKHANYWVGRFPVLALASFAVALGLAGSVRETAIHRFAARHTRFVLVVPAAVTALVCAVIAVKPEAGIGDHLLAGEHAAQHVVEGVAVALLVVTGAVHWRRWRLGGDRVQFALMTACWLSAQAMIALELGQQWRASWWDYHAYLLTGFGAAVYAVLANYRRSRTIDSVLGSVFSADPLAHIEQGYPEALKALVAAVEARDSYTAGHSARVAALAVELGVRLKLAPEALRHLAQGSLLHDIGKIGIPDHILNKPGRLDPEERAWIEQHPVIGSDLVRSAPSLRQAVDVVHHHHERIDGAGYPDRLAGDAIPLHARIAAVADVWDALTTDRAYRKGWSEADALAHVVAGRGTHLDPACVDALVELLGERGVAAGGAGDAEEVVAAAEACHAKEEEPVSGGAAGRGRAGG
jgi:HD-GYP domain-containing protein (c-di-GMP phosphodiesterase class II)